MYTEKEWECCCECKRITKLNTEVDAILTLRQPLKATTEVRHALDECDSGCPSGHYSKVMEFSFVGQATHWRTSGGCQSKLRVLRALLHIFPVLR